MLDTRRFDVPRYLSVLPLFSDLDPAETARVAEGCQLRRCERGDMVFRQGEPCDAFHVVVTGQVKLFGLSPTPTTALSSLIRPRARARPLGCAFRSSQRRQVIDDDQLPAR